MVVYESSGSTQQPQASFCMIFCKRIALFSALLASKLSW